MTDPDDSRYSAESSDAAVRFPTALPVWKAMRRTTDGRAWLARLPALVEEARQRWGLRLGAPYQGGSCSWVAPAVSGDGTRAVLKVTWPHREAAPEGPALRLWSGHGAVRVYAEDPQLGALLLERCEPGTELGAARHLPDEERLLIGCGVLRRLWSAGPRFPASRSAAPPWLERLADVAAEWAELVQERAARQPRLREEDAGVWRLGADLLRRLPEEAAEQVVLHGDFNPGNLLSARREPWLAIDAKPMAGDPAYDPWPLVEQLGAPFAAGDPRAVLRRRTALAAEALGLDVDRVRAWAVARRVEYVLWAAEQSDASTKHGDTHSGGDHRSGNESSRDHGVAYGAEPMRQARLLADLAGL